MPRDASQRQVIDKFSFVYTLTLVEALTSDQPSRELNSSQKDDFDLTDEWLVDRDEISSVSQKITAKQSENKLEAAKVNESQAASCNSNSALANTSAGNTATINSQWYQIEPISNTSGLNFGEIVKFSESESNVSDLNSDRDSSYSYLGKILFVFACSYLVFVVCWLNRDRTGMFFAWLAGQRQISISKSDAQFIDYLERSLANIDRQVQAQTKDSEDKVVFVPVHTPKVAPEPAPINGYTYIPQPIVPPPLPEPITQIPAPPPLAEPQPSITSTVDESVASAAPEVIPQPQVNHTLVGILDLGEQSAALFKVEGTTQRIFLGEEINNSGWILNSITSQTAKISNQEQVRSLSVGETF